MVFINKDEKRPQIRSKGDKDRQIIRLINECVRDNFVKILELLTSCEMQLRRKYVINKDERGRDRQKRV